MQKLEMLKSMQAEQHAHLAKERAEYEQAFAKGQQAQVKTAWFLWGLFGSL